MNLHYRKAQFNILDGNTCSTSATDDFQRGDLKKLSNFLRLERKVMQSGEKEVKGKAKEADYTQFKLQTPEDFLEVLFSRGGSRKRCLHQRDSAPVGLT